MEAFVLALSLWVVGARVRDADIQADEPRGEGGEAMVAVAAPGGAVVHGDALGQAVEAEDGRKLLLDGLSTLVGAGLQAQSKAGVVVEDGQRVAAGGVGGEVAFEVHLPKQVGCGVFEALEGPMLE